MSTGPMGSGKLAEYLTTAEAAELSGHHVNCIRKLARAGKVAATKKGAWLIDRVDLERYREEMKALGTDKFNWHRARN